MPDDILSNLVARLESLETTVKNQQKVIQHQTEIINSLQSHQMPSSAQKMSRKRLLKSMTALAVGTVTATTVLAGQTKTALAAPIINSDVVNAFTGTITGTGDGSIAVYGYASATTGLTYGVAGQTKSVSGIGVIGDATSTTGNNFGVQGIGRSNASTGVFGFASTDNGNTHGVWGQVFSSTGKAVYGKCIANSGRAFGVYGEVTASSSGIGVYGSSPYIGGEFQGTTAPLHLVAAASGTGAPATGNHLKGELFVDSAGSLFYCTTDGTPGKWVNLSGGSQISFLTKPIRVVATANSGGTAQLLSSDGTGNPNSSFQSVQISGVVVDSLSVPAGAKAIIGSLTSVGATTAGNLRLWPTGAATPTVNSLNIPLNPATGRGFNLTTSLIVGLNAAGQVSIGYSNGTVGSTCGYSLDVAGYFS